MQQDINTPVTWIHAFLLSLRWPMIVAAAFWTGRSVQKLEQRLAIAEADISALTNRHMPAIHRMLAEIRGLLERD